MAVGDSNRSCWLWGEHVTQAQARDVTIPQVNDGGNGGRNGKGAQTSDV